MRTTPQSAVPVTTVEYSAFQQAYDFYNNALFDDTLPHVLVTLPRQSRSMGYFRADGFSGRSRPGKVHELAMNPKYLGDTDDEILSTLVSRDGARLATGARPSRPRPLSQPGMGGEDARPRPASVLDREARRGDDRAARVALHPRQRTVREGDRTPPQDRLYVELAGGPPGSTLGCGRSGARSKPRPPARRNTPARAAG